MESSFTNLSTPNFETEFVGKIYVFRPITPSTKLTLVLLLVAIAIVAFGGNTLILLFLKTKERANSLLKTCSFQKNFVFYIKSLAISDVLASVIPIPYLGIQLYLDVFQSGWGCKIGRYVIILFPCVTVNNLLVINIGKFFATRTFNHSNLRKVVMFAWLAGFLIAMIPAATFDGIRYDLNETHYTVICRYDNQYLPFRIAFLSFTILQYIIPSCILITINVLLIMTVWKRTRRTINVAMDNGVRAMVRAARIRCIYVVIALTFAFVTPYFFYISYVIYNMVAKPKISFETDQVIRTGCIIMVFSNSAINVIIHIVQLKGFRTFLKEKLFSRFFNENPAIGVDDVEMQLQGNY
ncbi:uncharacterized protein LOC144664904 [Oculina patagonica]